ncbi:MAG: hypothetical protein M0R80_02825 [Proteobacteria bacterium]|jgi:hypothetical protein|nr:hypothetical protein [Pseudomonadota bacterium]
MSYQDRVDAAVVLIEKHNEVVGTGNPGTVDIGKFATFLKALGGTTEAALGSLKWEQISMCLGNALIVDCPVKPEQLAKDIADIFRNKSDEADTSDKPSYVGPKKVRQMTVRQLVEHFDPEEPESEVGKRLQGIVGRSPCIVFDKPGSRVVDVDATYSLVDELKRKYPPRPQAKGEVWAIVDVRGTTKPAYPIGYLPENFAEENPLYPGRPLRPDGTCDQTNRSWAGVLLAVRQFLRVGLQAGEIKITRIEDAHSFLDMALLPDAWDRLCKRYGTTKVKFDELKSHNKLPDLQIALGQPAPQGKTPNPFDGGAQVAWQQPVPYANYYSPTPQGTGVWGHAVRARHWNG